MIHLVNNLTKVLVHNADFSSIINELNIDQNSKSETFYLDSSANIETLAKEVVFAMAFGQSKKPVTDSPLKKILFYNTYYIDKGAGRKRRIDIPRNSLKEIQYYILKNILGKALAALPDFIVCKPNQSAIHGASKHIDAKYLVNMDLKDFYPSIRVNQVIFYLKNLERPDSLDYFKSTKEQAPKISHWEAVLVGKLLTWRGILPQGAPTSPAIANMVFERYDNQIIKKLGNGFQYSRYMDDITVSLTRSESKVAFVDSSTMMCRRVIVAVKESIKSSGFRLNPVKTKTTELGSFISGQAHKITGFRVGFGRISLPKSDCRFFRALLHNLEFSGANLFEIVNKNKRFLDSWKKMKISKFESQHFFPSHKKSVEWMAAKVVYRLHPNLVKVCDESGKPKKEKRGWLQDVLFELWNENLKAIPLEGNIIELISVNNDSKNLKIKADCRPDFLLLDKSLAVAVVQCFYWLTGQASRLRIPLKFYEVASEIRALQLKFQPWIYKLCIKVPVLSSSISSHPEKTNHEDLVKSRNTAKPKKFEKDVVKLLKNFEAYLATFGDDDAKNRDPINENQSTILATPIKQINDFKNWIVECRNVFVYNSKIIPQKIYANNVMDPFRVLVVFSQLLEGKRGSGYQLVELLTNKKTFELLSGKDISNLQKNIVKMLGSAYSKELIELDKECINLKYFDLATDLAKKFQVLNQWNIIGQKQVEDPKEHVIAKKWFCERAKEFKQVFKKFTDMDIFKENESGLNAAIKIIEDVTDFSSDNEACWGHLFELGAKIMIVCGEDGISDKKPWQDYKKRFETICPTGEKTSWLLFLLRCRMPLAHPLKPRTIKNWIHIQKEIGEIVGKIYEGCELNFTEDGNKALNLFPPKNHLEITAVEQWEAKNLILIRFITGLEKLARFLLKNVNLSEDK
jgi:hypothetical protein